MAGQRRVAACQGGQYAFSDHQHFGIGNRFGGERMAFARFKPENVSGQIETADLTAAVAENFVRADSSTDDLVKPISRLILVNDLYSARIVSDAADELHPAVKRLFLGLLFGGWLCWNWLIEQCGRMKRVFQHRRMRQHDSHSCRSRQNDQSTPRSSVF